MKAIMFGIQKIDFVPQGEDAKEIKGLKLHFGYEPTSDRSKASICGLKYEKQFVAYDSNLSLFGYKASELYQKFDSVKSSLKLPCTVEVDYAAEGKQIVFNGVKLIKEHDE